MKCTAFGMDTPNVGLRATDDLNAWRDELQNERPVSNLKTLAHMDQKASASRNEADAGAMAAIRASKKELRRAITQSLGNLSQESVQEQSRKITNTILSMDEYRTAGRISVYLSMDGKEVQTTSIVADALRAGKKVFVPYIYKRKREEGAPASSIMDMLALASQQDYDALGRDNWGIPSLSSESVEKRENCFGGTGLTPENESEFAHSGEGLDLIIMPGVAFDYELGRLGHGKGYYDKFLSRCKSLFDIGAIKKMPDTVGLALDGQLLAKGESVPLTSSDWRVNGIVTAAGTFRG